MCRKLGHIAVECPNRDKYINAIGEDCANIMDVSDSGHFIIYHFGIQEMSGLDAALKDKHSFMQNEH